MQKVSHTKEYKKNRQLKILEIISNKHINTQDQLAEEMIKAGYDMTQATLSRDINELRLTKISNGKGKSYYSTVSSLDVNNSNKYVSVLKEAYRSSEKAMNILVIKTAAGLAMAVAAALDNMGFKELLGCVAGDDTVICVTHNLEETNVLSNKIHELLI